MTRNSEAKPDTKLEDTKMSLRDSVLNVIGATMKAEQEKAEAKAKAKAEGKPTGGERQPKMPKSKSGNFMNIRHMGEYLMLAFEGKIGPEAFGKAIETEFPDSAAAFSNWQKGDHMGHFTYYRGYVLNDAVSHSDRIAEQLKEDGIDYSKALAAAKENLKANMKAKRTRQTA